MANPQSRPQLHRRAFVLGLVAVGAAGALAAATGAGEASPALPMAPDLLPEAAPPLGDALFRPGQDDAKVESVYWRRCWINRWGRRVCSYGGGPRRVCWWRYGRRVCVWR